LTTLAALISGIVASKSTQLPKIAAKVPNGTKPESRVKRFARRLDNKRILEEVYFLPYAELLLAPLALETLVLVRDGSVVGWATGSQSPGTPRLLGIRRDLRKPGGGRGIGICNRLLL
jgi:hypothetical protein